MVTYTFEGQDLGYVQIEDTSTTVATVDWQPVVGTLGDTQVIVMSAAKKIFDLQCFKEGAIADLRTWIAQIDTWVAASAVATYVSHLHASGGVSCKVLDGKASYNAGNPRVVTYTLKLIRTDTVI